MIRTMTLLIGLLVFGTLFGQGDFRQDSILTEEGIPGTTEYNPLSRTYFEDHQPNGRPGTVTTIRLTESGEWVPSRRILSTYEGNLVTERRVQRWSNTSADWVDDRARLQTFDDNGQLLSRISQAAPASGEPLENVRRQTFLYTGEQMLETVIVENWVTGAWQRFGRRQFSYTPDGEIVERRWQRWNGGAWIDQFRRVWQYGPLGFNA
ncbi:MAG: hypothetical protein KDC54_22215, partial [Lewinella sp.]|nr:hypothetical protein [Lewinella sp.]